MRVAALLLLLVSLVACVTPEQHKGYIANHNDGNPAEAQAELLADNDALNFKRLQLMAIQGDATAQTNLGVMFEQGRGVPKNYIEAVDWYKRAAMHGNAAAQFNLGVMFDQGRGVQRDYNQAIDWFRKSAIQGYSPAQYNLGVMYDRGRGVLQDNKQAIEWFKKAAMQGNAAAQFNLGVMYAEGQGVPQDFVRSYMWFNLVAAQGDSDAVKGRDLISNKMTIAQVQKAQELAIACEKRNYKSC